MIKYSRSFQCFI